MTAEVKMNLRYIIETATWSLLELGRLCELGGLCELMKKCELMRKTWFYGKYVSG